MARWARFNGKYDHLREEREEEERKEEGEKTEHYTLLPSMVLAAFPDVRCANFS